MKRWWVVLLFALPAMPVWGQATFTMSFSFQNPSGCSDCHKAHYLYAIYGNDCANINDTIGGAPGFTETDTENDCAGLAGTYTGTVQPQYFYRIFLKDDCGGSFELVDVPCGSSGTNVCESGTMTAQQGSTNQLGQCSQNCGSYSNGAVWNVQDQLQVLSWTYSVICTTFYNFCQNGNVGTYTATCNGGGCTVNGVTYAGNTQWIIGWTASGTPCAWYECVGGTNWTMFTDVEQDCASAAYLGDGHNYGPNQAPWSSMGQNGNLTSGYTPSPGSTNGAATGGPVTVPVNTNLAPPNAVNVANVADLGNAVQQGVSNALAGAGDTAAGVQQAVQNALDATNASGSTLQSFAVTNTPSGNDLVTELTTDGQLLQAQINQMTGIQSLANFYLTLGLPGPPAINLNIFGSGALLGGGSVPGTVDVRSNPYYQEMATFSRIIFSTLIGLTFIAALFWLLAYL